MYGIQRSTHGTAAAVGRSDAAMSDEMLANRLLRIANKAKLPRNGAVTAIAAGPKLECTSDTLMMRQILQLY